MAKETQTSEERKIRSDLATGRHRADLSLIISILALLASGLTAWTARDGKPSVRPAGGRRWR